MNRRGMALLLVLWFIVLLSGLAGISLGRAREGSLHARNRIALLRAEWAREGCLEIVLGRGRSDSTARVDPLAKLSLDSVDFGHGTWCSATLSDPGERLHLNRASPEALQQLFQDSSLTGAVVRGRPWDAVEQLPSDFDRWKSLLTVRGTGRINLLRAAPEVLGTVTGVGVDGAQQIIAVRAGFPVARSSEELVSRLNRVTRERIMSRYDRFTSEAGIGTETIVGTVEGHVATRPVVARMIVTLVAAGTRLAVIRREVE